MAERNKGNNGGFTFEIREFIGALEAANDNGWRREQKKSRDRVLKEIPSQSDHNLLSNTNSGIQYVNICTVMPL